MISTRFQGLLGKGFEKTAIVIKPKSTVMVHAHKYEEIWKRQILWILKILNSDSGDYRDLFLDGSEFSGVGNRRKSGYAFRLELDNGRVHNNIKGSAVARDLARVLLQDARTKLAVANKFVVFKMDPQFVLRIKNADLCLFRAFLSSFLRVLGCWGTPIIARG